MGFKLPTGFAGLTEKEAEFDRNAAEREKNGGDVGRYPFFLKFGESKNIIFLTGTQDGEDIPIVEQHNIELNGKLGNVFTCLKVIGEACPLCEANDRPQTIGFLFIIDRTPNASKKDASKIYKDQLRVFPAKFGALKVLKKLAAKNPGGLKAYEFEVSRSAGNAPTCGDTFDRGELHTKEAIIALLKGKKLSEVLGGSVSDFWGKYLAPKPAAELAAIVAAKQSGGSAPVTAGASAGASAGLTSVGPVDFD